MTDEVPIYTKDATPESRSLTSNIGPREESVSPLEKEPILLTEHKPTRLRRPSGSHMNEPDFSRVDSTSKSWSTREGFPETIRIPSGDNVLSTQKIMNNSNLCVGPRARRSNSRTSSSKSRRNSSQISPASMIFRNLLILEDDLRQQAHKQKILRWQYTTFLSTLTGTAGFATHELYITDVPARGLYRIFLQFTICFILITTVLFHMSGHYKRTIVTPRRFFSSANKGLKQLNLRLVRVHSSWDEHVTDFIRVVTNEIAKLNIWILENVFRLSGGNPIVRFWVNVTIRSQPRIGAVDVKLVLNPRAFSAEVREGWEIYRDEFWAREGARRRKKVNR